MCHILPTITITWMYNLASSPSPLSPIHLLCITCICIQMSSLVLVLCRKSSLLTCGFLLLVSILSCPNVQGHLNFLGCLHFWGRLHIRGHLHLISDPLILRYKGYEIWKRTFWRTLYGPMKDQGWSWTLWGSGLVFLESLDMSFLCLECKNKTWSSVSNST